jgi:ketosteroid isomerase-like protein
MSRNEQVAVVEAFFAAIVSKDLARLPVDPDLTAQSPLTPKLRGRAAVDYLEAVAANVRAIRVARHIVEGDIVATLFEEDTVHGTLPVFATFQIVAGRIVDTRAFYDPRPILASR